MSQPISASRLALQGGATTSLYLLGGLFVGLVLAFGLSALPLPLPELAEEVLAGAIVLAILIGASALWGRAMARLAGLADSLTSRRMTWAGALSYGPAAILAGITLSMLEVAIVERAQGPRLPIHNVFTLLFVPAAGLVAATGALALGLALKNPGLALRLAVQTGLAASLAFLALDLLMDALGYRVGAPRAAERATMLTVMFLGNLAASLAGGAVLGVALGRYAHALGRQAAPA